MATDRTAEIAEYWKTGDFSPEEMTDRVKMMIDRKEYEKVHKGQGPGAIAWLWKRVVRAYLDVSYLRERIDLYQRIHGDIVIRCGDLADELAEARARELAAIAEIEQLRDEKKRMAKKMCCYCWLSSVRNGANMHECGGCEWKGIQVGEESK